MKSTFQFFAAIICFFTSVESSAQNFHMVKDINDSKDGLPVNFSYFPDRNGVNYSYAILDSIAYFAANDGVHGSELWRSDGTNAGTYLVKDIMPQIVTSGKYIYFTATDSIHGTELWRSDGTNVGTVLVKDLTPGSLSSTLNYFVDVNGTLFFSARTSNGDELMKSDGTDTGTVMVTQIISPSFGFIEYLTNASGKFFLITDH